MLISMIFLKENINDQNCFKRMSTFSWVSSLRLSEW